LKSRLPNVISWNHSECSEVLNFIRWVSYALRRIFLNVWLRNVEPEQATWPSESSRTAKLNWKTLKFYKNIRWWCNYFICQFYFSKETINNSSHGREQQRVLLTLKSFLLPLIPYRFTRFLVTHSVGHLSRV